jgi:hypothetical protein
LAQTPALDPEPALLALWAPVWLLRNKFAWLMAA